MVREDDCKKKNSKNCEKENGTVVISRNKAKRSAENGEFAPRAMSADRRVSPEGKGVRYGEARERGLELGEKF